MDRRLELCIKIGLTQASVYPILRTPQVRPMMRRSALAFVFSILLVNASSAEAEDPFAEGKQRWSRRPHLQNGHDQTGLIV